MTESVRSLLPPNATKLERSLEQPMARVADLPVKVRDLWNPDTCPLPLLPWLAWSYGVTKWDSKWTEEQKRDSVRNALYVKRYKGTFTAVERALNLLGYSIRIVEWFQDMPRAAPYTFRIDVQLADIGIDDAMYMSMESIIADAKNLRSHLSSMRLVARSDALMSLGAAVCLGETVTVKPLPNPDISSSGSLLIRSGSVQEVQLYSRP